MLRLRSRGRTIAHDAKADTNAQFNPRVSPTSEDVDARARDRQVQRQGGKQAVPHESRAELVLPSDLHPRLGFGALPDLINAGACPQAGHK